MTLPHLSGSYFASVETRLNDITARITDIEGEEPETLAARISALEEWKADQDPAILSIELLGTATYVSVLGIDVLGSAAAGTLWAKVNEVVGALNSLILMSRSKGFIAT